MKNFIIIFGMLISFASFSQQNGSTTLYNKTTTRSNSGQYRTGMVISSSVSLLGCAFLAASATNKPGTQEEEKNQRNVNQAGFILIGTGFAGIIITNIAFNPSDKVSVAANAYGIGIKYRL